MKRTLLLGVGFVSLDFGMIGVVIPLLPTVPFLMLSAWCFARGSKRSMTGSRNRKSIKPI